MNIINSETLLASQITDIQSNNNVQIQKNMPSLSFETMMSQAKDIESNDYKVPEYKNDSKVENPSADEKTETSKESKVEEKEEKTTEKEVSKDSKKEEKTEEVEDKKDDAQLQIQVAQTQTEDKSQKKVSKSDENKELQINEIETEELNLSEINNPVNSKLVEENAKNQIKTEKNLKNNGEEEIKFDLSKALGEADEDLKDIDFKNLKNDSKAVEKTENKITVKDLRTQDSDKQNVISDKKADSKFAIDVKMNNDNTATITMNYANTDSSENLLSLNNQTAASEGSNFQAMLNNQIQHNIPDIVKTGSVILKDNDKGSINLILHPDDLGNVKIHLSMDGKTVSGHIIVATKEAAEVFKDNAQTLREAFEKNGFEAGSFNVSYNNSGSENGSNSSNQYNDSDFLVKQFYENSVSASDEVLLNFETEISSKKDKYSINIVA